MCATEMIPLMKDANTLSSPPVVNRIKAMMRNKCDRAGVDNETQTAIEIAADQLQHSYATIDLERMREVANIGSPADLEIFREK